MLTYSCCAGARGVLPLAAALAIVLLIFAAVATPAWFDRDDPGFADPAIDEGLLGLLTALLVPLQIHLITFAMSGFRQAWNVEVERGPERAPSAGLPPRRRLAALVVRLTRAPG